MTEAVVIALLSLAGTILGSGFGVITSSKLTNFRLEKLEEQVRQHNNIITRTYELEKQQAIFKEDIKHIEEGLQERE